MNFITSHDGFTLADLVSYEHRHNEANGEGILEEVIVTAAKREQNLQDVPIAVSVVSGEKIAEFDIRNLEAMAPYVPNFYQTATPTSNVVIIRGIGSGPNAGFEVAGASL